MGRIIQQAIGLLTGGAEGAGDAQDPSRTIASERALINQRRTCSEPKMGATSAFSRKIENHIHANAIHFLHYNFCRVHGSLRVTPAMEALLSDHVWSIEEMIGLLDRRSAVAA